MLAAKVLWGKYLELSSLTPSTLALRAILEAGGYFNLHFTHWGNRLQVSRIWSPLGARDQVPPPLDARLWLVPAGEAIV